MTSAVESRSESSRRLFSPTSEAERSRTGKRLLWAIPVALAVLIVIAIFGPSADEIDRKFTPYGAEGPLRIMPEIAIEDGLEEARRRAAAEATPPPPAPEYQVEPETFSPDAKDVAPASSEEAMDITGDGEPSVVPEDRTVSESADGDAAVDMYMPSQLTDSDFIIRKLVRPLYPAHASHLDRLRPLITVKAAFFVNEKAEIVAVMIQSNDGGTEYATVVREAMEQWEFEPRLRDGIPPAPRWLVVSWRFRSPLTAPSVR